jgi:photosystem II stability/assembly factor-like uncharacterized protein
LPINFFTSLAIDPQNPDNVYIAGQGEGQLFKSTDAGRTWGALKYNFSMNRCCASFYSLLMYPQNPASVLYVATGYMDGCCGGLFRSADGGASWETL